MSSMAVRATFTGLDPYKHNGVTVTDRVLGHGSYATVLELEYMGLKCAGKKIHDVLLEQGNASYTVRRFEEECRLLSQVRHPNVVQFLGVHFQQRVPAPILVMEFLPTNLTSCIKQYGILPKEIGYSILHDVSLGLCYLHSQTPTIIHRDLSSNNILLATNMSAKISDLGVARMLSLTPLHVSRMTQTPGTPAYMPPEVMIANPRYDTSVDEFSYGIMMIHIFSGRWPEPQVGPNQIKGDRLVPVTEAERREIFLQAIGNDHPLMDLILKCINNDPRRRAHASEIVERLTAMVLQFPASFANRLEMLRQIEHLEEEKREMREEREAENQLKDQQISNLRTEAQEKDVRLHLAYSSEMKILQHRVRDVKYQNQQKDQQISKLRKEAQEKEEENVRLHLAYSSEVEGLQLQVRDVNAQNQLFAATKEANVTELRTKIAVYEDQIKKLAVKHENGNKRFESVIARQREQFLTQQENGRQRFEMELARQREEFERRLTKEKELCKRLTRENDELQGDNIQLYAKISQSLTNSNSLEQKITTVEAETSRRDATVERKESELEAKTRALEEKDTIISRMREQLTRAREYLSSKQQVGITWKECTDLPTRLSDEKATIINGKVYCGGGETDSDDKHIVYCYDLSQDNWTTLPPLSVRWFGLGQVNGKLVAIGGVKKSNGRPTIEVFTYDERSRKWKQTLPQMQTARICPGVLSLQSALLVVGGMTSILGEYTDSVEIFKANTSQWYRTDRLPTACFNISPVIIGSTCYALGGYKYSHLNQALYASVDDLLRNSVLANQTTHNTSGSSADNQSAWRTLTNPPTYQPTAAVLAGNLLAIGGREIPGGGDAKKEIYMFSLSTHSWIYISDLPEPQSETATAVLSSTEILVIGGRCGERMMNTTYKGTLHLKL